MKHHEKIQFTKSRGKEKEALIHIIQICCSNETRRIRAYSDFRTVYSDFSPEEVFDVDMKFQYTAAELKDTELVDICNTFMYYLNERSKKAFGYFSWISRKYVKGPSKRHLSADIQMLLFDMMEFMCHGDKRLLEAHGVLFRWYKSLHSERLLCPGTLCLLLIFRKTIDWTPFEFDQASSDQITEWYNLNMSEIRIEIDDFVIDKHTKMGKKAGKGTITFALEGAYVANEDKRFLVIPFRRKYLAVRGVDIGTIDKLYPPVCVSKPILYFIPASQRESDCFILKCRAQLVTSRSKTDTYFAQKVTNGSGVFVKGPFLQRSDLEIPLVLNEFKKHLVHLSAQEMKVEWYIPNLFGKTPLGVRNKCISRTLYPFDLHRFGFSTFDGSSYTF